MNLTQFLDSKARNAWIVYDDGEAYVRKATRCVDSTRKSTYCLDVANVASTVEGRGDFGRFLAHALDLAGKNGFEAVFVESILNPLVRGMLERRGYSEATSQDCMYLRIPRNVAEIEQSISA